MQAARVPTFRMYHQVRYSSFPICKVGRVHEVVCCFGRDRRCAWWFFRWRCWSFFTIHNFDFKWTIYVVLHLAWCEVEQLRKVFRSWIYKGLLFGSLEAHGVLIRLKIQPIFHVVSITLKMFLMNYWQLFSVAIPSWHLWFEWHIFLTALEFAWFMNPFNSQRGSMAIHDVLVTNSW